jgi:hypothetical protein
MLSPPDGGIMSPKMRFATEARRDETPRLAPGAIRPTAYHPSAHFPLPTSYFPLPTALPPMAIYGEMAIYGRRACPSDDHLR